MENTNIYFKNIIKGAGILLIGIIISKFLTYFYRLVIARYLGPTEYGTLSIGLAIIGLITTLALLGFPQGILRFVSYYQGKNEKENTNSIIKISIITTLIISIILSIVLYLFLDKIAISIFNNKTLIPIMKVLIISIPFGVLLTNLEMITQAFKAVKYIVISRNIVENLIKLVLTILFLIIGIKIIGAAIAYVISIIVGSILLLYFLQKKINPIKEFTITRSDAIKQLVSFSLPLLFYDFMLVAITYIDTLILGYYTKADIVGIYNVINPTARIVHIIPVALQALFYPIICETYAKEGELKKGIYKLITKWIFFIGVPISLIITLYPKQILNILFGQEYIIGYLALIIITIAYFIYSLIFTSISILGLYKKTKLIFINKLFAIIINIILNIILIPKYGLNGAAIALASTFIIEAILIEIEAYCITKIIPFKWNYINVVIASLISVVFVFIINHLIKLNDIYTVIISSIILITVYTICLFILPKSIEAEDKEIIKIGINKIKNILNWN